MNSVISSRSITTPQAQQTTPLTQLRKRYNYYALYVFCMLFVATLLNGLDASEFLSASNVIGREMHLSLGEIGALASAFTIFLTVSIIPIGLLADRMRRSQVIAACLAVWSLATAFTGLASNFAGLFVTRMVTGIGEAGYGPAGNSLVGDFFKDEQRAKVMSGLAIAGVIGPLIGMVLGGVIAGLAFGSWRLAFLITGIPGVLLALCAWRLREPVRQQSGAPANQATIYSAWKPQEIFNQFRALLRIKSFVCLLVIGVMTTFTGTALPTYFPTLLQQHDTFGLTSGQAASFAGLILGPVALAGVLFGGYLADRLDRRNKGSRILVCTLSVLLTAPLNVASLVIMITTHNLVLFCAVMVPAFFINTLHMGPLTTAVVDVVPTEQRASAVAISLFIERILGTAFAPLLIGMLAASFDPTGLHFLHSMAGHDLVLALIYTCPLAFLIAGGAGLLGLRWVSQDRVAAEKGAIA
jgi:MFS family permease